MIFKRLIAAIDNLANSNYELAASMRVSEVEVGSYDASLEAQEARLVSIMEKIRATEALYTDHEPVSVPLGRVFYTNPESLDRQDTLEEVVEYLKDRGYSAEAEKEVRNLLGPLE